MTSSLAPKPVSVSDLERDRVAQRGQPAFGAVAVLFVDEVVDDVEQVLQLRLGERAPFRGNGIVSGVSRCVPLKTNLRWNVTELLLAERNPPIPAVTDIRTEHRDRVAVGPQRRQFDRRFPRPEVREELIDIKWSPAPRILVGELDEPADEAAPRRDGAQRQTPSQHLSSPPVDHRVQDCFIGP
jgi:hypothetical protein